jgi:hypothetical protein
MSGLVGAVLMQGAARKSNAVARSKQLPYDAVRVGV